MRKCIKLSIAPPAKHSTLWQAASQAQSPAQCPKLWLLDPARHLWGASWKTVRHCDPARCTMSHSPHHLGAAIAGNAPPRGGFGGGGKGPLVLLELVDRLVGRGAWAELNLVHFGSNGVLADISCFSSEIGVCALSCQSFELWQLIMRYCVKFQSYSGFGKLGGGFVGVHVLGEQGGPCEKMLESGRAKSKQWGRRLLKRPASAPTVGSPSSGQSSWAWWLFWMAWGLLIGQATKWNS